MRDDIDPWESRLGARGVRLRKVYVRSRVALVFWGLAVLVAVILRNAAPDLFQSTFVVVAAILAEAVAVVVIIVTQLVSRSLLVGVIQNRTGISAKRIGRDNFSATALYDLWLDRARARQ